MRDKGPTFGEQLVRRLMQGLPQDSFYCYAEPRIDSATKKSRYPDFAIVWREKGVILIEVKDYLNIVNGNGMRITIESDGKEKQFENPVQTARDYALLTKEKLEERRELLAKHFGEEKLCFPVEPLVVLTNQDRTRVSWLEKLLVFPPDSVLCSNDLVSSQTFSTALQHVRWTFPLSKPLSDAQIRVIARVFVSVEVRSKPESDDDPGVKRGSLTPEQEEIVWSPLPHRPSGISTTLVRGVVGSGKTIVIMKRAERLADLRPDLKILVTTFNKDLAADLKRRIRNPKIQVNQDQELIREILGVDYPQIHLYRGDLDPLPTKKWCEDNQGLFDLPVDFVSLEISRRKDLDLESERQYRNDLINRGPDLVEDEIKELITIYSLYLKDQEERRSREEPWEDYEDTVKMALKAVHRHKYRRHFDIIMVDEGQDFSPNKFELLRNMIKAGGYLFVCDDPMQSLWRQFDLADRGLGKAEIKLLKLPMRTTREIAEAAQSLFDLVPAIRTDDDDEIYPAQTEHLESGDKPRLVAFPSREHEREYLLGRVQQHLAEQPSESIALFTPNFCKEWKEMLEPKGVYYGHFNMIKGLEFDTVFIAYLDDVFQSSWNQRVITRRWLYRKLFVAMTRARHSLFMSYTGELPEPIAPLRYYCQNDQFSTEFES